MDNPERNAALDALTKQWGAYVLTFQYLSEAKQAEFLQRQGYHRLADLLAHVTAWWDLGMKSIRRYQSDPGYQGASIDVDAFNATAVENAKELEEGDVIRAFERARVDFLELVATLSDEDWKNPKISQRIHIELIGHYQEHVIE